MAEASSTEDVITLRIRFKSETLEKFTERYAADLTQNEIFIRTRDPLPVGTMLALDLSLNDGSVLIVGRGSVAWTRGPELTREAPSGMGIRFEALNAPSRTMLARILEAKARLANHQPAFPHATADRGPPLPEPRSESRVEVREPPRARQESRPVAIASPPEKAAAPRSSRVSGTMPVPTVPAAAVPTAPAARLPAPAPSALASAPTSPGTPVRSMRNAFVEEDAEPTELASLPPSFFYEGGGESDQEQTRLQDPRASAALLQQQQLLDDADLEEDDGDDDQDLQDAVAADEAEIEAEAYDDVEHEDDEAAVSEEIAVDDTEASNLGTNGGGDYGDDDDVTNVRASASLYSGAAARTTQPRAPEPTPPLRGFTPAQTPSQFPTMPPAAAPSNDWTVPPPSRTNRPERRTPPTQYSYGGQPLGATREIKAPPPQATGDNRLTDANPLILSTTNTERMPSDPNAGWRPPPLPGATSTPYGVPSPFPSAPSLATPDRDPFPREPFPSRAPTPPITGDGRWGPGTLESMSTAPALPAVGALDSHPGQPMTPAWPVPSGDPAARKMAEPPEEEGAGGRFASVKMWVALTLAAGGIVAAALLLLPALLRPATAPTPQAAAPTEPSSAPAAESAQAASPAEAAIESVKETAKETPPPAAEAAKQAATPPAAAPATPPPATAPGSAPAAAAAGAVKEAAPAPAAAAAEKGPGLRPGARGPGGRPLRGRSVREVIAAADARERAEPAAAAPAPAPPAEVEPKAAAPASPPAAVQGEGAEDVFWLTVRSIPSGADVLIDGQVEGQTPFVRRIFDPTRSYALTVRRAGFEPHDRTLSTSDVWTKRGNVRTLTVVAKLTPAAGPPTAPEVPGPVSPTRGADPSVPTSDPPAVGPPPIEPDRKTNPFAEPSAGGSTSPQ